MVYHKQLDERALFVVLKPGRVTMAGNARLKIFGTLHCTSGKKMNKINRVFFTGRREAEEAGYWPCGHCLRKEYVWWKLKQAE